MQKEATRTLWVTLGVSATLPTTLVEQLERGELRVDDVFYVGVEPRHGLDPGCVSKIEGAEIQVQEFDPTVEDRAQRTLGLTDPE
jgi:hypothetical protein